MRAVPLSYLKNVMFLGPLSVSNQNQREYTWLLYFMGNINGVHTLPETVVADFHVIWSGLEFHIQMHKNNNQCWWSYLMTQPLATHVQGQSSSSQLSFPSPSPTNKAIHGFCFIISEWHNEKWCQKYCERSPLLMRSVRPYVKMRRARRIARVKQVACSSPSGETWKGRIKWCNSVSLLFCLSLYRRGREWQH